MLLPREIFHSFVFKVLEYCFWFCYDTIPERLKLNGKQ